MQQRNFILFIIISLFIFVGWFWVQQQLWPPPTKKKQDAVAKKEDKQKPKEQEEKPRKLATWEQLKDPQRELALRFWPTPATALEALVSAAPYDFKQPPKTPEPAPDTIVIGGDKSHIQAILTTRGAGVQKLVLNRFQQANWLGEPAKGKLELIQEDPIVPSFLMYHYPTPDAKGEDPVPVLTLGTHVWKLEDKLEKDGEVREVKFSTNVPDPNYKHIRLVKTYKLEPKTYHLSLLLEFEDTRDPKGKAEPTKFRYQLMGPHGLPIEGEWYTATYRDAMIGLVDSSNSLWRTKEDAMHISHKGGGDKVPEGDRGTSFLQYAMVANQFYTTGIVVDDKQPEGTDRKAILAWARPTQESQEKPGRVVEIEGDSMLVAHTGGAQLYKLLPRTVQHAKEARLGKGSAVVVSYYELPDGERVATWVRPGQSPRGFFDDVTVRAVSEVFDLKPGDQVAHRFLLYNGPVKTMLLGQFSGEEAVDGDWVDRYTYKLHLNTLTDYRSAGPFGAFAQAIRFTDLLIFLTRAMHWLLYWLHFLAIGSWGVSILLLTVLVRGLMFPISRKQAYFSIKMQELAPELKKLKDRYPNDRQAQSQAMMELYRKHGVSPLGGCLPMFMQLPIFLALYYCLQESIHFRLAGFLWIDNLAAPDMLFWISESIPWISEPDNLGGMFYLGPYFNLLPCVAVALLMVQQKYMTPPPQDEQQEMTQKMMKWMMILMAILFYKVASGLCLYFIASSAWGLIERRFLPKKPTAAAPGAAPTFASGKPIPSVVKGKQKGKPGKKEDKPDGTLQKVKDWWAEVLKQARKK